MLSLSRPIRDRRRSDRSSCSLWQNCWKGYCGRWHANRTAVESVCYAGELVVLGPLDAVRRHLPL